MSTDFATYCIKVVSKFLKKDILYQDFFNAVNAALQELENAINELKGNFFFDSMTDEAVIFMEKFMKITPLSSQTIENRRETVRAKWRSSGHNCIELLQKVCDCWKNGEIEADFVNKKIQIKFVGQYGIPDDLNALKNALEEVKPAHLAYVIVYKYLLKKNIHHTLTKAQMQTYKKHQYCNVGI